MISIYYTELPESERASFYTSHSFEVPQPDWLSGRRAITHTGSSGTYYVYCDAPLNQIRSDSGVAHSVPPGTTVDITAQKLDELERKIFTVMSRSEEAKGLFDSRIKAMDEQIKAMGQHIEDLERRKSEAEVVNENLKEQAEEFAETITELEDELAEARKHEQIPKPPFDLYQDPYDPIDRSKIPPPPKVSPNIYRAPTTRPYITNTTNPRDLQDEKDRILRDMANRMLRKNI